MTTIYLIRHAEAEGNLYRRIHGWYNSLITENGYAQIAALERRFTDIPVDAVYSSDLFRTMVTARAVYRPKGLELHTDPQLRELHMGDWEDQPWGQVHHDDPEGLKSFNSSSPGWRAPHGESLHDVGRRLEGAVKRIARRHPEQTVAVFSHGTAIRQLLGNVKGVRPEDWGRLGHSDNTAVSRLTWDGERLELDFEGDNSHLDESISTLARQSWWKRGDGLVSDINLWYRPLNMTYELELYLQARRDAWRTIHGEGPFFDGEGFLRSAKEHLARTPWGVTCAMSGENLAGIVELDPERYAGDNAGYIPFCYIVPSERGKGLGVQLLGHAVAFYRPLGRDKLRLRCASYNAVAQRFYARYGFVKIGEESGSRVPLDILEKYIGFAKSE